MTRMRSPKDVGRYLEGVLSPAIHPGSLALFRLLYCAALFYFLWDYDEQIPSFFQDRLYAPVPTFDWLGLSIPSELHARILYWGLLAGLALGGVGIGNRAPLMLAALAFFCLQGLQMGFMKSPFNPYVYHSRNLAFFILVVMALMPASAYQNVVRALRRPPEASCSAWPVQLIKLILSIAYFGASFGRLTHGLQWLDGYTLQAYLLERYLLNDNLLALALAQSLPLCVIGSWLTVLFELFFFLTVFLPRTALFFVPAGLAMHGAILVVMDINFFPFFVTAYLAFVVDLRQAFLKRRNRAPRPAPAAMSPAAKLVAAGMTSTLLFCVFTRVEHWPFTDFAVFDRPHHWSRLQVTRLGLRLPDGSFRWSASKDFCNVFPNNFLTRYRAAAGVGADGYVDRLVDEAVRAADADRIPDGSALRVVRRTVRVREGVVDVDDALLAEHPVQGRRSLCPGDRLKR